MMLWLAFAVMFVAGPLLFRLWTRQVPTGRRLMYLGIVMVAAVLAGLTLRYRAETGWGDHVGVTLAALGLLWLGWIAVLALGAQSVVQRAATAQGRRWTRVIGTAGTTAPWFGLAFASWITG